MLKRSLIEKAITEAISFFKEHNYPLPPFAYWTVEDWAKPRPEAAELIATRIGWDVTDFDSGDFVNIGRTIFTLRNGKHGSTDYPKSYAQKVMFLKEGQYSVIHYHKSKMEDIINNGGGKIAICFWKAQKDNSLSNEPLTLQIDGCARVLQPGEELLLAPGQSVSIPPFTYHKFWAKQGTGHVLSMEVSSVCDDLTDNFWYQQAKRFPEIEEDAPRVHVLCSEYGKQ